MANSTLDYLSDGTDLGVPQYSSILDLEVSRGLGNFPFDPVLYIQVKVPPTGGVPAIGALMTVSPTAQIILEGSNDQTLWAPLLSTGLIARKGILDMGASFDPANAAYPDGYDVLKIEVPMDRVRFIRLNYGATSSSDYGPVGNCAFVAGFNLGRSDTRPYPRNYTV